MAAGPPQGRLVTAGPVADPATRHLKSGLALPDIALAATDGKPMSPRWLPGWSVLYIYPWTGRPGLPNPPGWDDIPGAHGSTPQAEGFRALAGDYAARSVAIVGISGQTPAEQREFSTRLGLPFVLLSDAGLVFAQALNLPRFQAGANSYLRRLTLICKDGVLIEAVSPVEDPAGHASALLPRLDGHVRRQDEP
jgi:peroxiredoxin